MEEWKDIAGFEGLYQVSSEGRVRSLDRVVSSVNKGTECEMKFTGRVLAPKTDRYGYRKVVIINKTRVYISIHRLVGGAFIPNPENLPQIDHINRIKTDNRVSNLRWASAQDNCLNRSCVNTNTGEKYITYYEKKRLYLLSIRRGGVRVLGKCFKTLPEAIEARNNFIIT